MHIRKLEECGLVEINTVTVNTVPGKMCYLNKEKLMVRIPNYLKVNQSFKEIQFSAELGSEAPGYCEEYPSDICFHINGIPIGHWTSTGDFGDVTGVLNPDWWPPHLNQYGVLKLIRINQHGSFIDGCHISEVTIDDIGLNYKSDITLRLSVSDQSENKGGLTIFGKGFGNFSQDLLVRVLYHVHGEDTCSGFL